MKFVVDRRSWYRGQQEGSLLLREDGRRCCIGFVGQQCGIPDSQLLNVGIVDYQMRIDKNTGEKWPEWMRLPCAISEAYEINDLVGISEDKRESQLKQIFKDNGDEIEFIN